MNPIKLHCRGLGLTNRLFSKYDHAYNQSIAVQCEGKVRPASLQIMFISVYFPPLQPVEESYFYCAGES